MDPDDDPASWTTYTNRQIRAVYIADGFHEDCLMLLKKYTEMDSLRFEDFCRLWKNTKFSYVFQGRPYDVELAELTEEFLFIAKSFIMEPGNTFKERVGALYLLYALFYTQPIHKFATIYVTPENRDVLLEIEKQARAGRHFDVLYVLGRILLDGGTHYQAADRMHGLEEEVRRNLEGQVSVERLTSRTGAAASCHEELGLLRELASVCRRYKMLKTAAQEAMGGPDRNLAYVSDHLDSELAASFTLLMKTGRYRTPDEADHENRGDTIAKLKDKAMGAQVQKSQHLMDGPELKRKKSQEKRNSRITRDKSGSSGTSDEDESCKAMTKRTKRKKPKSTASTPTKNKGSPTKTKKTPSKKKRKISITSPEKIDNEGTNDSVQILPSVNPMIVVDDSQSQSLGVIDEASTSAVAETSKEVSEVDNNVSKSLEIELIPMARSKKVENDAELDIDMERLSSLSEKIKPVKRRAKQRFRVKDAQVNEEELKKLLEVPKELTLTERVSKSIRKKQVLVVPQEDVPPLAQKPTKTYRNRRVPVLQKVESLAKGGK